MLRTDWSILEGKFAALGKEIDEIQEEMVRIKYNLDKIGERVSKLEFNYNKMAKRIEALEASSALRF